MMATPWGRRLSRFWIEWLKPLLVAAVVLGTFRSAVADWNDVPTGSMKPTILEGDRIFVNKVAYDLRVPFTTWRLAEWGDPERGDIAVFFSPADGRRLVKRVIGIPGDRLELRQNQLYVNGSPAVYGALDAEVVAQLGPAQQLAYRFAREEVDNRSHPVMLAPWRAAFDSFAPVVVPLRQYFVMGDNRDDSLDSRWFGFVSRDSIVGRATAVVASLNPDHYYLPRWDRFFSRLP
jgi:signal peptidase I